jgi:hypothetical protein
LKILLIEPPPNSHDIVTGIAGLAEPLALECVASGVPEHEVKILDMRIDRNLQKKLERFKPDIVGATCNVVGVYVAKELLREVKKFDSNIFTVLGGHHAQEHQKPHILKPKVQLIPLSQ